MKKLICTLHPALIVAVDALLVYSLAKKEAELRMLENLHNTRISGQQFVNIIGRLRLYEAMDGSQKKYLPIVNFGDQAA